MSQQERSRRFPQRKNPRLAGFDYSGPNCYFITVCTHGKNCIFGMPNDRSPLGKIAGVAIPEIENHFPGIHVDKRIVMPNHIHAIIRVERAGIHLSVVVGQYKAYVTKRIHSQNPNLRVWQTSFHDHIIWNQRDYDRIWEYIDTNPARWQEDCFYPARS